MTETRKVVINACYGGFSLSPKATKRYAELEGRECYFFVNPRGGKFGIDFERYERVSEEQAKSEALGFWTAFDVPDPPKTLSGEAWHTATDDERQASNELYRRHNISNREIARDDERLVQVVEELGEEANGSCAKLKVVEIPADAEWEIDEYDGNEHIAEKHRTWS